MNDKKYHKLASAKHYLENKEFYKERNRKRKEAVREWYWEYKKTLKCSKCFENHPACLEFHHRNRDEKEVKISRAISNRWSPERILIEIAKCDVLCSNCHQKLHWELDSKYQKVWNLENIPE